jgi:hypothetical protein
MECVNRHGSPRFRIGLRIGFWFACVRCFRLRLWWSFRLRLRLRLRLGFWFRFRFRSGLGALVYKLRLELLDLVVGSSKLLDNGQSVSHMSCSLPDN